jgi:hypothetical protein
MRAGDLPGTVPHESMSDLLHTLDSALSSDPEVQPEVKRSNPWTTLRSSVQAVRAVNHLQRAANQAYATGPDVNEQVRKAAELREAEITAYEDPDEEDAESTWQETKRQLEALQVTNTVSFQF